MTGAGTAKMMTMALAVVRNPLTIMRVERNDTQA
jgi:hypothetical protein